MNRVLAINARIDRGAARTFQDISHYWNVGVWRHKLARWLVKGVVLPALLLVFMLLVFWSFAL